VRTLATAAAFLVIASLIVQAQSGSFSKPSAQAPGSFADVENGKIYYEECGSGAPTLVLIHDGIAHSAVWDAVWPAFCAKFHTIRYDRRGYGKSPEATTWYYETDDLATLLHRLKVARAVIVGSSHGGELSIDFTLAHPDMVQQLVLVGAVVSGFPYSDHFLNRGMANSKPLEKNDVKVAIANWAKDKYVLAPGHDAAQKKLLDVLSASPQDLNHQDYARSTQAALPRLREIHVPTMILTGDADIPDVHAHAGAIEAGIRGSRRVVVSDAGHLMYLEKPEEFTRIVMGFIESNYAGAAN